MKLSTRTMTSKGEGGENSGFEETRQSQHNKFNIFKLYEDKRWSRRSWFNELAPFRGILLDIKVSK